PETLWKDVVAAVTPALTPRAGRYYYPTPGGSARNQQEQIRQAVRKLIRAYKDAAASIERRGEDRLDFIQTAQVHTEDGRSFTLLSRDLSSTGIRLVGTKRLLGQKVRVTLPSADSGETVTFVVRVLWTCAIGDDLFENGGSFLEVQQ